MNAVWIIGRQSMQYLMKDRMSLIWFLLVPLMYIFIFGNAFRSGGDPAESRAYLAVRNLDDGPLSERLLTSLRGDHLQLDTTAAEAAPLRLLTVPEHFSMHLLRGDTAVLAFEKKESTDAEPDMTVELSLQKARFRLLADLTELKLKQLPVDSAGFALLDSRPELVGLNTAFAGRHLTVPSGFNQQVPAQIVQFTLLMLFIYAANAVLDERQKGLLRRIKTTSVSFMQLYLGKLLFVFLLGMTQTALILLAGHFIFGVYYGSAPLALVLVSAVYILAVGSMGLCLGFAIHNPEKLLGTAIISALGMAALSGCWWPLEITPEWMQNAAMVLPSGLALKSYHMLISFGRGLESVWPYLLALLGIAVLFSSLFGVILYRYQEN